MTIGRIRDYAVESVDLIDSYIVMQSCVNDNGKILYVKEIEVIRGLLQNLIFWCDITLEKKTSENQSSNPEN